MYFREKSVIAGAAVVLASLAGGCSGNPSAPVVQVPPHVLSAPTEIVVGTTTLRLGTYLWRDFMPSTDPDTRLLALLRIQSANGDPVPAELEIERAWIVLNDAAWVSIPRQETPAYDPSIVEYMSRGGPAWPVGAVVTAVVQLRYAGNSYLLRADSQIITRTD